jgi:hypothetical protein
MTKTENFNLQNWLTIGNKIINGSKYIVCFAIESNCEQNYMKLRDNVNKFLESLDEVGTVYISD